MDLSLRYLDKTEFDGCGRRLFELMYHNMNPIAPFKNDYETECADWLRIYGGAFKNRAERKILLVTAPNGEIVGFFGYCPNGEVFDMEEIQLSPEIQGKDGIFRRIYETVLRDLPDGIRLVEACANEGNKRSQGILGGLGLKQINRDDERRILFFRGDFADLLAWYNGK